MRVKASQRYATVRCRVPGCRKWFAIDELPGGKLPVRLLKGPFDTVCPHCSWIQSMTTAEIVCQRGSKIDTTE
jgi:hypothetical protein